MVTESNILHVFADFPERLSAAVARYAAVPAETAEAWIRFGAVYCDGARTLEEKKLRGGEYLRIHPNPRRFPGTLAIDWPSVVVEEHDHFLVVDKPAGVPIHPTLDNAHENVVANLEKLRGERLFVTQRLDLPTSGLCIVARTKTFQSNFNRRLADGAVTKRYRALVRGYPPLGRAVAYQEPSDRAPKRMAYEAMPGWKKCSLVVESVEPEGPQSRIIVLLETGRTHQIRAQLSLLGHPLVGDELYGDEASSAIALRSFELSFRDDGMDYRWRLP